MILPNSEVDYCIAQNEQQFKMLFLNKAYNRDKFFTFCIETEETVKGFPDVMCIDKSNDKVSFEEFKFTKTGKIKFQPTQPAFYRKYPELQIGIVALNWKSGKVHFFLKEELFTQGSPYKLNDKAEVDLVMAEATARGALK